MGKPGGVGVAAFVAAGMLTITACGPRINAVIGRITQSPGCGVVRPDQPVCPNRPVAGEVQFRKADGTVAARTRTTAEGYYVASVPPGAYVLHIDTGAGPWPQCPDTPVEVKTNGGLQTFDVVCGSGIR